MSEHAAEFTPGSPGARRREKEEPLSSARRPVVFVDRDGTLNEELGYIFNVDDLVLLPGAAEAVIRLNGAGVACIVVTNQSGPARGFYSEAHVQKLNERLARLLAEQGAVLDGVYYCPHHADGVVEEYAIACDCRKPATGMLARAFSEHPDLDAARGYVVGDQSTDIDLARNAGLKSVLVKTGFGEAVKSGKYQWPVQPDHVADTIGHAVDWILNDLGLS
ncbi:MAG TPA: HAD family hydrolase [Candidatus Obscuribacterales bacterium]